MILSKWSSKLFPSRVLSSRDRRKIRPVLRRPRHCNNFRPLVEELEPIIVMSSVVWTGASGDWSAAASWTDSSDGSHHVPGLTDDAVINTAVTVTHSANSDSAQSVTLGAASLASNLTISGGTLTVSGTVQNQGIGALTLANGTLAGATIAAGTALQLAAGANSSTLSGVTLNSALSVPGNTTLNVTNGLALNSATLSDNGTLNFSGGTQAVTTGGGGVISGGGTVKANTGGSTITFGTGVTVSGGLNVGIGSSAEVTWIVQGTASAGIGQTLTLSASGDSLIIQGVCQSISGGALTLAGNWTNSGVITVSGATSTLNLAGSFTIADIGTINHTTGAVNIAGSLNNIGSTLALNTTTGTWNLSNGTIRGGIITTAGSAVLNIAPNTNTLNGVTLNGTVALPSFAILNITNGLVLNSGTLSVNGALNLTGGTQGLTGTGAISGAGGIRADTPDSTITFGPDVSLSGGLNVGGSSSPGVIWIFQDTVSAGFAQTLSLGGGPNAFINEGALQSISGGTLNLGGNFTNNGTITVTGTSSTLNLSGNFATAGLGIINHTSGTVNIVGSLDNTGSTLVLNNTTGTWNLASGTITGGIITTAGSAVLTIFGEGTFSGVTVAGVVSMAGFSRINITQGLTLNGGTLLGDGTLNLRGGTQAVIGTGTISGAGVIQADTTGSTITLGSGVSLSGGISVGGFNDVGVIWIIQGPVSVTSGQTSSFGSSRDAYVNHGAWQVTNGGTLTIGGAWSNNGTITVTGSTSTFNMWGTFTTAGIGTLNNNGIINVFGTLDNTGSTLALSNTTGTWNLMSVPNNIGTIIGGAVTTSGSAVLNVAQRSTGILSGVTLEGTATLPGFASLNITNGLAFDGGTLSTNGTLIFSGGPQSITGTGVISGGGSIYSDHSGATITFASGVTLSGSLSIGGSSGTHNWIFQGIVSANISGQTLTFFGTDTFDNQGTFEARNGGTLLLAVGITNYSGTTLTGGTWQVFAGSKILLLGSGIATDTATIILDGSGSNIYRDVAGTLDALAGLTAVSAGGSLAIQNGRIFTTATALSNAGSLAIGSGSTFTESGAYSQTGTLDLQGALSLTAGGTSSGPITDAGTLVIGGGHVFTESGAYSQTGTLIVQPGSSLALTGAFSNFDGAGTLTGGAYYIAGTLRFNNAAITTNAASVVLDGAGPAAIVDETGADALANFAANAATGTFTIQNSLALFLSGDFTNAGAMVIGTDSALAVSGTFTQTSGGTTKLSSGAALTSFGGVYILSGSSLSGAGTINADVLNAGQMSIGDSTTTGVLTINGFFLQTASGTLTIKVGGFTTAGTDFDQLIVTSGHIGGTLNVALINGYTPATGDSIAVMTFDSVTGTFAELSGDGGLFTAAYDPMDVKLTAN